MSVRVSIPTPLRGYAGNKDTVYVKGETVGEVLNALIQDYPALRNHLFADDGMIRGFVNVYVNEDDIRYLQKRETKVSETDNVSIIPSIAGGLL